MISLDKMSPYKPPVSPTLFMPLFIVLLGVGISHMAWFFIYEATITKGKRSFLKESRLAIISSICLSLGTLFLFLYFGVWL